MTESEKELLDKAFELGKKYEKENTGCAQTVIAAIFETLDIWNEDVFKAASGLADGLGLTGNGTCGSLVGASMVISWLYPREKKDFKDPLKPMKAYALVKKLHDQFVEKFGSCRCHDIQKRLMGRTYNLWNQKELNEAFSSGMLDHCSTVVGNAAQLAVQIILEERNKNKKHKH